MEAADRRSAANRLAELGAAENPKAGEKKVLMAVDDVTHRPANTRNIARAPYTNPRVIDHYPEGSVVAYYGGRLREIIAVEQGGLAEGEEAIQGLLNRRPRRDLENAA